MKNKIIELEIGQIYDIIYTIDNSLSEDYLSNIIYCYNENNVYVFKDKTKHIHKIPANYLLEVSPHKEVWEKDNLYIQYWKDNLIYSASLVKKTKTTFILESVINRKRLQFTFDKKTLSDRNVLKEANYLIYYHSKSYIKKYNNETKKKHLSYLLDN